MLNVCVCVRERERERLLTRGVRGLLAGCSAALSPVPWLHSRQARSDRSLPFQVPHRLYAQPAGAGFLRGEAETDAGAGEVHSPRRRYVLYPFQCAGRCVYVWKEKSLNGISERRASSALNL